VGNPNQILLPTRRLPHGREREAPDADRSESTAALRSGFSFSQSKPKKTCPLLVAAANKHLKRYAK
jgi:hypothetical protein